LQTAIDPSICGTVVGNGIKACRPSCSVCSKFPFVLNGKEVFIVSAATFHKAAYTSTHNLLTSLNKLSPPTSSLEIHCKCDGQLSSLFQVRFKYFNGSRVKPGANDGFLSGKIENIVFTLTKIRGQSFVHVTSEPVLIGYTRKMGSPADGGQMFFIRGQLSVQNSEQKCVFFPQTMDFCPKTNVFGQTSIVCARLKRRSFISF
jgi:hypothetical protein